MVHDLILKVQLFLSELSAKADSPHFLEQLLIIQPESTASDTYGKYRKIPRHRECRGLHLFSILPYFMSTGFLIVSF